ncbi:hypothetical protein F4779DRAFT_631226 [Xylariaceae sp. FL0662B]|nr:hypothetical protein F4779DRAFT_631226 [Xylariaceae sp. FL0662B]
MTASRRQRYPRLRYSPSRILQKKAYANALRYGARQRADRLPLLTLQRWLAKQHALDDATVSAPTSAISASEWRDRLAALASRGWTKDDIDHWIWILSAEDGDGRVQRFLSTNISKPIFLLLLLTRSDEVFRGPQHLLSLMEYASKHYTNAHSSLAGAKQTLTVAQFLILLRRLVKHVQNLCPRSLVTVARFVGDYIQSIAPDTHTNSYHLRCKVFGNALWLFKRPAATHPLLNMEFNWRAQKLLLAMSDGLDKPLIINKLSYRAIRQVMVGLKKSKTERAVALRYAKSWPPYRQDFDGLDAKRTPEDDQSRSVKAGTLMREAGYVEDEYDRALDALGGRGADSPTIQTRSLSPKEWTGDSQEQNLYSRWAMTVRATRNPQEAWRAFNDHDQFQGHSPNYQVYAEMFIKLQARPLDSNSSALPGDSRENLPIHDANYSEYELARLSPPTVAELYGQMISRGIKPEGHLLYSLVRNASSVEEGLRYLRDSGIDQTSVSALALYKKPSWQALWRIPLLAFSSYIQLLCRLQPNRRGRERLPNDELLRIPHAINLVKTRLRPGSTEGATFQQPWLFLLRALARPYICVLNGTQAENDAWALALSMDVYQLARGGTGIAPELFIYLCRTVEKVAVSRLDSLQESPFAGAVVEDGSPLIPSAQATLKMLKETFSRLTAPAETDTKGLDVTNQFWTPLGPAHLHAYMRALAFLEDTPGMVDLARWILVHRKHIDAEVEHIEGRGSALIAKTLCAFYAFAGPALGPEQQEELTSRMEDIAKTGSPWRWPTSEEIENYIQYDRRGGSREILEAGEATCTCSPTPIRCKTSSPDQTPEISRQTNVTVEIPQSTLIQPRSHFEVFTPPAPEARERDALAALLDAADLRQSASEEYVEFDLHDFAIYVNSEFYPDELRPLQHLAIRLSSDRFYFDGVISFGETRFYLRTIPFRELPIGNYGADAHTVGDQIWIRSELNEKGGKEIYYKLGSPSAEYVRFHRPFLWIADLAKHVIDYCNHLEEKGRRAVIHDFKSRFSIWACRKHSKSAAFERWYSAANSKNDFRGAPGDVISTPPDDARVTDTRWRQETSKHHDGENLPWFGLVQKVHQSPRGRRSFDVIWMYQSSHTPCGVMKYPWTNELFLSNNCTCHHNMAKIQADQILATHSVEWFGNPSTSAEFFVRQTYLTDDCRWTTLQEEHLTCRDREAQPSYEIGDAVLVEVKALRLEPFIVEALIEEGDEPYVRLRRLLRRKDVDKDAIKSPPNELVYSHQLVEIASKRIYGRCLVRAFQPGEKIPTPYDRNGTGNVFFMTHQQIITDGKVTYMPLDLGRLGHLRQGFDPFHMNQKLQGLDLFCGGGNFGRGLEDGGAVEMRWANDIWSQAIHTYMANCEPDVCTPFLGSVDDLLLRALVGDGGKVPRPGDVQFISAGSPCPGFSLLTIDKNTDKQRKNQSLVASFASYVDLYRPHYGLLENVLQMVRPTKDKDKCVFSQLVCALVGLGYQVQVMFLDAWSHGEPQSRSRVFLCFAAPGFRTLRNPRPSHSHLPKTPLHKFGETSCGLPLDKREIVPTPFKYDGKADYCIGFPDHRLSILCIPTQPWGMNFDKAWFGRKPWLSPVITPAERQLFPAEPAQRVKRGSKGWTRIDPTGLFGTIATACTPTDARMGASNHWHQPRPVSVMEAKRAQGFLDHEVLIGSPGDQRRIIGNSVARKVSLALGLAIREAWLGTLLDEEPRPQTGIVVSSEKIAEPNTAGVVVDDRITTIDTSSSSSEEPEPMLVPTPLLKASSKSLSHELTPATSEYSNEVSDRENGTRNGRKRSSAFFVEICAKRPRPIR